VFLNHHARLKTGLVVIMLASYLALRISAVGIWDLSRKLLP